VAAELGYECVSVHVDRAAELPRDPLVRLAYWQLVPHRAGRPPLEHRSRLAVVGQDERPLRATGDAKRLRMAGLPSLQAAAVERHDAPHFAVAAEAHGDGSEILGSQSPGGLELHIPFEDLKKYLK